MKAKLSAVLTGAVIAVLAIPASRAAPPPAQSSATEAPASSAVSEQLGQMEARMKLMQEQMQRIREARTPAERSKLLREHMQTMFEQMRAMRAMGGSMMHGMMGQRMRRGGMMRGGMMGGGMMGGDGMMGSGTSAVTPAEQRQWMQDRLDMMQMMMEQMMGEMQAMQGMGMGRNAPHR